MDYIQAVCAKTEQWVQENGEAPLQVKVSAELDRLLSISALKYRTIPQEEDHLPRVNRISCSKGVVPVMVDEKLPGLKFEIVPQT